MAVIILPDMLVKHTNSQTELNVTGKTVVEVLQQLAADYPTLRPYLFNEQGDLNPFMAYYLNQTQNIRDASGIDTPLDTHDSLSLVPAMAGG